MVTTKIMSIEHVQNTEESKNTNRKKKEKQTMKHKGRQQEKKRQTKEVKTDRKQLPNGSTKSFWPVTTLNINYTIKIISHLN